MSRTRRTAATPVVPIEDDERHQDAVAAYIDRNRDALNESLRRSRVEVAKGKVSTKSIDDIIKEGRQRHGSVA